MPVSGSMAATDLAARGRDACMPFSSAAARLFIFLLDLLDILQKAAVVKTGYCSAKQCFSVDMYVGGCNKGNGIMGGMGPIISFPALHPPFPH